MRGRNKPEPEPREQRTHCPECAVYLDDVIIKQDVILKEELAQGAGSRFDRTMDRQAPGAVMSPYPGLQFRRYTRGSIYDLLGFFVPCCCEAGNSVAAGYKNEERADNNRRRMDRSYHLLPEAGEGEAGLLAVAPVYSLGGQA